MPADGKLPSDEGEKSLRCHFASAATEKKIYKKSISFCGNAIKGGIFILHKTKLETLVHVALLIAIEIVLTFFCSIQTPIVRIGLGFVPIAVCGMLFGPVWAGVAYGIGDILGSFLFSGMGYFPPLTISYILTGVVFGLCLYKRKEGWLPILCAAGINCLVISLFITTYWLHLLRGAPYLGVFIPRIVQCSIMLPIQFVVMRFLQKPIFLYSSKRLSV